MKGIALKIAFNDGGSNGGVIGFNGVCSLSGIINNVRSHPHTNCCKEDSPCRIYSDGNFQGKAPAVIDRAHSWCYESTLFSGEGPLRFGAGFYHTGNRKGQPIPIVSASKGDIAILTTRLPNTAETERIVFGCFRLAREPFYEDGWGYAIESDGTMDIKLPDYVALQTSFWRYYKNSNGTEKWNTGLFRYLDDARCDFFLSDLLGLLGDTEERDVLVNALGGKVKPRPIKRLPVITGNPLGRGYGGGEGAAHLNLKNFVAKNPLAIGLPKDAVAEVEYAFLCGDQVDIKFDLPGGKAAVVEIETTVPFPGAHQCIKYRALLEAALGSPINSGKVEAILVAHQFDKATRDFAAKYNIRLVVLSA